MSAKLLTIPPELRLEIYEYVFASIDKQSICIIRRRRNSLHKHLDLVLKRAGKESRTPSLALLGVCRLIYQEAVKVVYENCHIGLWLHGSDIGTNMIEETKLFTDTMSNHLRFISHLELGIWDLKGFVPYSTSDDTDNKRIISTEEKVDSTLRRLLGRYGNAGGWSDRVTAESIPIQVFEVLARAMPNVRSVTYHHMRDLRDEPLISMMDLTKKLKTYFPRLGEVQMLRLRGKRLVFSTASLATIVEPRYEPKSEEKKDEL